MTGHNNHHAAHAETGERIRRAKGAGVGTAHMHGAKQRHGHLLEGSIHEPTDDVTGQAAFALGIVVLLCSTYRRPKFQMTENVTLRDANQRFARLIRQVEGGADFVITRNGAPVARLTPMSGARTLTPEQEAALERTIARAKVGWALGVGKLDRDALHER
jgi:prevent-host-death family protein